MTLFLRAWFVVVILAGLCDMPRGVGTRANPIRRVITMLQHMMKKCDDTAIVEEKLFDKYMCQCKKNMGNLQISIDNCNEKVPQLEASIQETSALKQSLEQALAQAKEDKEGAENSLRQAEAMRNADAQAFAKESVEATENIKAMTLAIEALEKGISQQSFLQTSSAPWLQGMLAVGKPARGYDRDALAAFLQQGDSTEDSSEIIGILKQMKEDMENDLAASKKAEAEAIAEFQALDSAKTKQINAARLAIEDKSTRLAAVKVQLVQLKADYKDTKDRLADDLATFGRTKTACAKRDYEYGILKKSLAAERIALAETIKILADDQASDLFRKTAVTSSSSSAAATFLQVGSVSRWRQKQALQLLRDTSAQHPDQPALQLIAKRMASSAKRRGAKGFEKIIALIDNMIALLDKEAKDDVLKKEMCDKGLAKNEDLKANLENGIKSKAAEINNLKDQLAMVERDMAKLRADLAALDKAVKEATEQRKEENAVFLEMMAQTNQAVGILEVAKKRLKEFYTNAFLQQMPEQKEDVPSFLQEVQSSTENVEESDEYTFMASSRGQQRKPQSDAGKAVIKMIGQIQMDLKREFQEAKKEEDEAQDEYEVLLEDAKKKRESSAKAMTEKEGAKAGLQEELKKQKDRKNGLEEELLETIDVLKDLHEECDWLLKNFEERNKLREAEKEALRKTKAVLAGADYKS